MLNWTYRVIKSIEEDGVIALAIHEVYTDEEGKIKFWTESPVKLMWEQGEDVNKMFVRMQKAVTKPFLVEKEKDGKVFLTEEE